MMMIKTLTFIYWARIMGQALCLINASLHLEAHLLIMHIS